MRMRSRALSGAVRLGPSLAVDSACAARLRRLGAAYVLPSVSTSVYVLYNWKNNQPPRSFRKGAMHLCGRVDIYGFAQSDGHYYKRTPPPWGGSIFGKNGANQRKAMGVNGVLSCSTGALF
eukprot:scaffold570_cov382-Prasinococcus_capsulatus_cf.AAC.18